MSKRDRFDAFSLHGGPVMVFKAEILLYPQVDHSIKDFILASRTWLKMQAKQLLESGQGSRRVRRRWREIVDGTFFDTVESEPLPWEG